MQWREKYKDKIVGSAKEAVSVVKSGDIVTFQQVHGETKEFLQAIVDRAEELKDVKIVGNLHWGPADYAKPEYKESFRGISNFIGPNTRPYCSAGQMDFLPLFYYQLEEVYTTSLAPDVFLLMLTPPDEQGRCSFGLNADFSVACAASAKKVVVQINPSMPYTHGSYFSLEDATCIYEKDEPIHEVFMAQVGDLELQMGKYIAPLIPDGATLQLGIGGVPDAVLSCLTDKKDLGIHSELFSDGVVDLYEAGVITNQKKTLYPGKFIANFLIGSKKLFDFVDKNEDVLILPVHITNHPQIIAQNENMISINSCLQVDLYGQIAADTLGGKQFSGVGGQVDFVRGAQMSKGGKSIITVRSTALKETVSNIVLHLPQGTPVTTSRFDVQYVCSEYGIVNLRGLTVSDRAKALIRIAHPKFRDELEKQAREAKMITD